MAALAQFLAVANVAAFAVLALAALREWRLGRSRAARWAALAFGALAFAVIAARVLPEGQGVLAERVLGRSVVVALLLFPYLLFRFAAAFRPVPRRLEWVLGAMTLLLVGWTWAAPTFPEPGEPRPAWFLAYLAAFLTHWAVLAVAVAVRLWRAGGGEPSVARRRMRTLSIAAAVLTAALFAAAANADAAALRVGANALALASAFAFLLALSPPWLARVVWRRPEQERLREAIGELMRATSEEDVAERVLEPIGRMVGARAVALYSADGRLLGTSGLDRAARERLEHGGPDELPGERQGVEFEAGELAVWTSPYAPFFGAEELSLMQTLGELTGLALDRARLFAQEREARSALERADAVKSNFIALAAHELRSPVTALHGVAETLQERGHELPEPRKLQLERLLLSQSSRLRLLVEQLLDLSRLEAEGVQIDPRPLRVRERVEDVVAAVLGEPGAAVEVDVEPGLEAPLDPAAFDRIVTNLVVNASRYGSPPIRVRAELRDRHFRLTVEDHGSGVPQELVPRLFDRFTRGAAAPRGAAGSGLGLAIARSYAQAHEGELLYEEAEPHGARFQLVLPVEPRDAEAHVLRRAARWYA